MTCAPQIILSSATMYPHVLPFTRSIVIRQTLIDSFIVFLISFHQFRFYDSPDEFEALLISLLQLFYFDSNKKKEGEKLKFEEVKKQRT